MATAALSLTGCVLFTECTRDGDLPPNKLPYVTLIYMAADNSTDIDVDSTINKMKEGAKKSKGTTVVYLDRKINRHDYSAFHKMVRKRFWKKATWRKIRQTQPP